MQISTRKGSLRNGSSALNFFESYELAINKGFTACEGHEIEFIESLILAQDERWRRA